MGSADEFRCAAEFGERSGCRNLRDRLAPPNLRSCKCSCTGTGFDRYGFAGEHGLVEQDFSGRKPHIRRNHAAKRELHDIARHELHSRQVLPRTITPDGRAQREPRFQCSKRCLGTAFLEKSKSGVEYQQAGDDRGFDELAECNFKQDGGFEHPRNWRPELCQNHPQGLSRHLRRCVRARCRQSAASLVAGKTFRRTFLRETGRIVWRRARCVGQRGHDVVVSSLVLTHAITHVSWSIGGDDIALLNGRTNLHLLPGQCT